ncbi:MAG: S9 family peptidase, partial [Candidatus Eremiobacteraeota bacterium]|nr:S9 family peptidase [Candidatus Eremiobacteraeota bacterium]
MTLRLLAMALICAANAAPALAGVTLVGEDDYRLLVALHAPAVAPDGKIAALVVSSVVWDEDRRTDELVSVDLESGARQTLVSNRTGLSDPAFSPDGTRLAFLADEGSGDGAVSQVFVMPRGGGAATAITHAKAGVKQFAWRPDGLAVAYAAEEPEAQLTGADRFRNSFIFTTEPIVARAASRPVHLFVQRIGGQAAAQLTFGSSSVADGSTISWSPDGTTLAFTLCRSATLNDQSYSHVALLDVASKRVHSLTGRTMWEADPRFSPDGANIAYAYSDGDPQVSLVRLYVTTPAGGRGSPLSESIDRSIGDAVWSRDSKSLVVAVPDRTTNAFYRVSLHGAVSRIDVGGLTPGIPLTTTGGADAPALANAIADDGTLVFVATFTAQPPELFAYSPERGTVRLTGFNAALGQFAWGRAERLTFPTTTGVAGDGVLYFPPDFSSNRRYPLVVYIHGGPSDPSMLEFDFWAQVMAARGWLVLRPNYRGSPNLGLRYQRAILYDPEDGPGRDVMAAVHAGRARGIVDASRIAVSGWSYG